MPAVLWFRRDLRLHDNPALLAAAQVDGEVVGLFVVDDRLWRPAGPVRRTYLSRSLRALDRSLGGRLLVIHGDPVTAVPALARSVGAPSVHVAADFAPYGSRRDLAVQQALGEIPMVSTESPYAVAPGRVRTAAGRPFQVYTPFYRAWRAHGWRQPAADPDTLEWVRPVEGDGAPPDAELGGLTLPPAGESEALARWTAFLERDLEGYAERRDRADLAGTSSLSAALRFGEIHPRTLLGELGESAGHETFRKELAWREFHADLLASEPASARLYLRPEFALMAYDRDDAAFEAWTEGRTGFPFVDAGMRQLRAEGWMHNRVRMVVASFLVKDLHQEWTRGAREFMHWLRDGDLASNQLNWQWVAGSGADAAPYFRVFNPVLQGLKFDPSGDYVRRYVPELRGVAGAAVHEPWDLPGGVPPGYPERIVDHALERRVALDRFAALR